MIFLNNEDQLLHLSSGVVADPIIASDMKDMVEKGERSALNYIRNNILCENPDIYACIKRTNLKTFSSLSKKVRSKNSKGEIVALRNSKDLFARMLLLAQSRELNLKEILKYSLRPFPRPLPTTDGDLVKTVKSKLLSTIEAQVPNCQIERIDGDKACILDAMSILQTLSAIPNTFKELAMRLLEIVVKCTVSHRAKRVDFVCDTYPAKSIKNLERERRASSGTQVIRIVNGQQRVPRQWKKFMASGENKEKLSKFIFYTWQIVDPILLHGVEVLVTHERKQIHE